MIESAELERALAVARERVAAACRRAGRDPSEVRLVGATKEVPPSAVRVAFEAGLMDFGENFVRELLQKRDAVPGARWHFIGRLQRNKVHRLLGAADVVHTLEPGPAAERLARLAEERGHRVDCLVEVDFAGHRVGVAPDEAEPFTAEFAARPGVRLKGLMTVPPLGEPPRPYFARLRELRDRLAMSAPWLRELSMGMSADYEEAIEEGATMVRVGSAIFGPRP